MKTRILLIAAPLVVALGLAAITLPGSASSAAAEAGGITVQGTASVTSVPDRAELSFGVESKGQTRVRRSAANAAEMRRVIAALKAAGGTDVKTQYVSLSPQYNEKSEAQGFVATNTVSATIKELAKAGAVIDAAVNAGANQVYGPSLSHGDQAELYRHALKAAVANARANAQALAVRIEPLARPHHHDRRGRRLVAAAVRRRRQGDGAESTPIEPGTQQTTANVTVTFSVS